MGYLIINENLKANKGIMYLKVQPKRIRDDKDIEGRWNKIVW